MQPARVVVFLPCHTLDDFPAWLEEGEADDVLACWTAAWDPRLLAAGGRVPGWASVDLQPPDEEPLLGVVPAAFDVRFATQADATATAGSRWVRGICGTAAVAAATLDAAGIDGPATGFEEDFRALGLAVLLAELLARRMRSEAGLEATGFSAAAIAAARAAVAGDAADARERLGECFGFLSASRARYYPVDLWLVDLVLLAETTLGAALVAELAAPTPLGVVATGRLVERLAAEHPASLARLRERCAAGTASACGGRDTDGALALETAEELFASFERGRDAWERHVGVAPATFARAGGGGSALMPAVLGGLGYLGAVWPLFDGTPLPDPGGSRIRWEGSGEATIDAIARPPVDVREARAILALPERLGDAIDHDHVAVVMFAHHAGTACTWHGLLRRIGAWSDALGTFVTPDELFRRTPGAGAAVAFEPDAFPVPPPPAAVPDPLAAAVAATAAEARRIVAAAAALDPFLPPSASAPAAVAARPQARAGGRWPWSRRRAAELVLDNGLVRLEAHPRSGGLLSLRRPADRINRLSQQLAPRTTRPAPAAGAAWETVEERAEYGRMEAEAVALVKTTDGTDCIESRGRLWAADGRASGRFTQRMTLAPDLPLAWIDLDIVLDEAVAGPLWERHVACRFAWHENEDAEVFRSLHTQAITTERTRFTAPHFVLVRGGRGVADDVAILTAGLPWHVRSSPHVLDAIVLAGDATAATRRLGIGLGLPRPWEASLHLAAGGRPRVGAGPDSVRLTGGRVEHAVDRRRLTVGLLESAGRTGHVRIEWAREPLAARACDLAGRPRGDVAVAIEGRSTVVFLRRHEWLHLLLDFPP